MMEGATQERILEAAFEEFLSRGYAAVSVREIIEPLGISKGGFYHHYASKEELFLAVVDRVLGEWVGSITTVVADTARSVEERLHRLFLSPVNRPGIPYGLLYEGLRVSQEAGARTAAVVRELFSRCRVLLVEGQERSEVRQFLDCDSWAFQIASLVEGGFLLSTLGGVSHLEDQLQRAFETTWRALRAVDLSG